MADKGHRRVEGERVLREAYEELESELPERVANAVRWMRAPERRWFRIGFGVLFIAGGLMWFLPVLGIELLPIGLLLLAQDIPFLQKPIGRAMHWLVAKYREFSAAWKNWRERRRHRESH